MFLSDAHMTELILQVFVEGFFLILTFVGPPINLWTNFSKNQQKCPLSTSWRVWVSVSLKLRRKLCTGRQPIVNRVVARKATDWSQFCKRCETGNSIGLCSVSECTRKLLMPERVGHTKLVVILCNRRNNQNT